MKKQIITTASYNPWHLGGMTWKELALRAWKEAYAHDLLGRSAQLAFYLLLAVFPALLFLTALLGLLPEVPVTPSLLKSMRTVLPDDALSLLQHYLQQVAAGSGSSILSLGLLGALWASSSGLAAIMETLNVAYGVEETRPYWKVRVIAAMLTIALAGFIIVATGLVLAGQYLAHWIADQMGLGNVFTVLWSVLQWPVAIALMLLVVGVIYYVAPNVEPQWRWLSPGAVLAVGMWLAVSLGFKMYVDNFGNYNAAYGSIAGVIALMLWFYWSGIALLLGGEINAEIAHAAKAVVASKTPRKSTAFTSPTRRHAVQSSGSRNGD
jgi:membrane protein